MLITVAYVSTFLFRVLFIRGPQPRVDDQCRSIGRREEVPYIISVSLLPECECIFVLRALLRVCL